MAVSQFVTALKSCCKNQDLDYGRELHRNAIAAGMHTNKYVAASLIRMYSKCQMMVLARQVFDQSIHRDVVTWTSLILGYVENGQSSKALDLFSTIDCEPNSFTYVAVLKACGCLASENVSWSQCLEKGIAIHKKVKHRNLDKYTMVANTLIDMYCKCGSMHFAREVFDTMTQRDVIAWNYLILGYVENGQSLAALDLFYSMDCEPSHVTFVAALKACVGLLAEDFQRDDCIKRGIGIHQVVKSRKLDSNIVVANTLIDMYSKCGSMELAKEVFDSITINRTVVSWNAIILGYLENGEFLRALELFSGMDCSPSSVTYLAALKACSKLHDLDKGISIHEQLKNSKMDRDLSVANTLLDMYSKCGSIENAKIVFDSMVHRDIVSWNSLILGYTDNGESSLAMELFTTIDCEPNSITYIAALKACENLTLSAGQIVHARICRSGLEQKLSIATSLINLYGKHGIVSKAEHLFNATLSPSMISWNALIAGYGSLGKSSKVV